MSVKEVGEEKLLDVVEYTMHTRWVGLFPASYPGASFSRPELSVFVGARERGKGGALDPLRLVEKYQKPPLHEIKGAAPVTELNKKLFFNKTQLLFLVH